MNTANIDKAIALLQGKKLNELQNLLLFERQKSILESKGAKMKLSQVVKRILKRAEGHKCAYVMIDEQGHQSICDGYMYIYWHTFNEELNAFPTSREIKITKERAIPQRQECTEHKITDDERLIIANLDKYIKLYKDKTENPIPIYLFGKQLDARLLLDFFGVVGKDLQYIYTHRYMICAFEKDCSAVLMILRADNTQRTIDRTLDFVNLLKSQDK